MGSSGSRHVPAESELRYRGSQQDPKTPHGQVEYEGDSSLAAHADFASRVLENAITTDLTIARYDEMASIMKDVRNTVRAVGTPITDAAGSFQETPPVGENPPQESLPPVQLTLNCLRMLKGQ